MRIVAVIFGIVALIGAYLLFGNYSVGTRSGILVKISHKGYVFKTYEGELNLGGYNTDGSVSNYVSGIWRFSVSPHDKRLVKDLQALQGYPVKLYYREKYFRLPWRGDTKYMVYKVEKVGDKPRTERIFMKKEEREALEKQRQVLSRQ
ncbi:MAG: hypothetical protein KatS3mg033_0131 [Thermonema sp.]|jgi:hypothetical protein|uniref:hypothetical protein n=1 Tax=Thermonema sp. TaxID=2231181 RepID=UPI0021DF050A|nr:hypothetical protein [Thermonema sp.]GIV38331.1 MAG: hypothetical protein KatS3mg033_0131 [Thermonema sp.]